MEYTYDENRIAKLKDIYDKISELENKIDSNKERIKTTTCDTTMLIDDNRHYMQLLTELKGELETIRKEVYAKGND